jgi:hypothetical protein
MTRSVYSRPYFLVFNDLSISQIKKLSESKEADPGPRIFTLKKYVSFLRYIPASYIYVVSLH